MYLQSIPIPSQRIKVSVDDTLPDFLSSKLLAGTGVSLTVGNDGANETLTVANTDTGSAAVSSHLSAFSHAPLSATAFMAGSVLFSNGTTIAQDNATLFWDSGNKRLGIGTAAPTGALSVLGSGSRFSTGVGGLSATGGSALAVIANTTTAAAAVFTIHSNVGGTNSEKLRMQADGNLGISTTAPTRRLDILDTTNPQIRLTHTAGSVYGEIQALSTGYMQITASGGRIGLGVTPTSYLDINGDIETLSTGVFYFGDPTTDGTWSILRDGNNLLFKRRESGSYVTKQTISA